MAMCLAQFVLSDDEYAEHWKNYAMTTGKWLIMDNALAEEGRPVAPDQLLEAAKRVRPQEIVIPDLLDPEQNVKLASQFLQYPPIIEFIRTYGTRLMYVPHGSDLRQWMGNLMAMTSFDRIPDSIGISKFHDRIHPNSAVYGRGPLGAIARGLFPEHPLHYLGLGLPPLELKYMLFGRSCDTSVAAMYAYHGLQLAHDGTLFRAENVEFDFEAQFDVRAERRVIHNMNVLNNLATWFEGTAHSPWLNG